MKTILFNPYKDRWICKLSKNDIKNSGKLWIVSRTTYPIRIGSFTNTDKDKGFTNGLILRITN